MIHGIYPSISVIHGIWPFGIAFFWIEFQFFKESQSVSLSFVFLFFIFAIYRNTFVLFAIQKYRLRSCLIQTRVPSLMNITWMKWKSKPEPPWSPSAIAPATSSFRGTSWASHWQSHFYLSDLVRRRTTMDRKCWITTPLFYCWTACSNELSLMRTLKCQVMAVFRSIQMKSNVRCCWLYRRTKETTRAQTMALINWCIKKISVTSDQTQINSKWWTVNMLTTIAVTWTWNVWNQNHKLNSLFRQKIALQLCMKLLTWTPMKVLSMKMMILKWSWLNRNLKDPTTWLLGPKLEA